MVTMLLKADEKAVAMRLSATRRTRLVASSVATPRPGPDTGACCGRRAGWRAGWVVWGELA
ncbi:hypothetical protein IG631_16807 [Alternaria alternata]|nr:hypothetical protein IG631_16807 [Alternaria alternata]